MKLHLSVPRIRLLLWLLFILGSGIGLFAQFYYHKFLNIDTLSYINIAELYAAGKFNLALNGVWSPLYSWIIGIMLLVKIPAITSCYVLNFLGAAITFHFLQKISLLFLREVRLFVLFNLFLIFYLLNQALSALTPDLIATAIGCYFIFLLLADDFPISKRKQLLAGITAAFFYIAKSYNFLFISGLLLLLMLIYLLKPRNPTTVSKRKAYLFTFIIFLIASGCWIIPLSIHERKLTFSTAGAYVYSMVHPDNKDHPASERIVPPPFPEAYSAWIDPSDHLDSMQWSPAKTERFYDHQKFLIKSSFKTWWYILDPHLIKTATIFLVIILCFVFPGIKDALTERSIFLLYVVTLSYPLGYLPIFVFERYILVSVLFFNLIFFYFLQVLTSRLNQTLRSVVILLVILLFIFAVGKYVSGMWKQKKFEYENYRAVFNRKADFDFLKGKKIVSTKSCHVLATQICYWYKSRFYGIWNNSELAIAKQFEVEYILSSLPIKELSSSLERNITIRGYPVYMYRLK